MELIWCFIFVLRGERRGRGGLGPGSEQPPAQRSALPQAPPGAVGPCSRLPRPPSPPPASPSDGAVTAWLGDGCGHPQPAARRGSAAGWHRKGPGPREDASEGSVCAGQPTRGLSAHVRSLS